jgi:hypothetical protein
MARVGNSSATTTWMRTITSTSIREASPADYTPVPKLRQNIFGANLGGPLFIPHVFNTSRQKTFFFYNQEWRRIIQSSAPATNPTMPNADRPTAGTNLQYVAPAYATNQVIYIPTVAQVPDPAFAAKLAAAGLAGMRGQPFPNQIIPASLFDPNAVLYYQSSILPHANTLREIRQQPRKPLPRR